MEQLVWVGVNGYESLYKVSSSGDIMVLPKKVGFGKGYIQKGRLSKLRTDKNGYKILTFSKKDVRKTIKIHRVVAIAFIPNPENKPQVNHKNGIKSDNRVENLEWVTGSENVIHGFKVLKRKNPKWGRGRFGKLHAKSRPIIQYNMNGDFIKEWESMNIACLVLGINGGTGGISSCCRGVSKKAYGFKWKYKETV